VIANAFAGATNSYRHWLQLGLKGQGAAPSLLRWTSATGDQEWQSLSGESAGQGADAAAAVPAPVSLCKILDIFEGTQQIQQLIVARRLLGKTSAELK
jgi:hypothetical protein